MGMPTPPLRTLQCTPQNRSDGKIDALKSRLPLLATCPRLMAEIHCTADNQHTARDSHDPQSLVQQRNTENRADQRS